MRKVLSLFLALSMLLSVCAVNILAEDTVTLTVPNGNFAKQTDSENGTLPDNWQLKLFENSRFPMESNQLCYAIGAYAGGTSENSTLGSTANDGSLSLMIKHPSGAGYGHLMIETPKISLGSTLTEEKQFTTTFDHKRGNATQAIQVATFFYNEEGQVYNGTEWVPEVTEPASDASWQFKDAAGNNSYYADKGSTLNQWIANSYDTVAPVGTSAVSVAIISSSSGAIRFFIDNIGLSYKSLATSAGLAPVTDLQAAAGDKQVTLSWKLPADTANYAGVKIAVKNGEDLVKEIFVEDAQKTSETVTQLENNVSYTFEVYAMNAGKTEFSEAVTVSQTPRQPGQVLPLPVRNPIADRTIYADDYEMSIDLNILPFEGSIPAGTEEQTNVFDKLNTELVFTSDTPGVSFRDILYDLDGSTTITKQQLVYTPSGAAEEPITVNVTAETKDGSQKGTTSFQVTVNAVPEEEKPAGDPEAEIQYLYVPNAGFERWGAGITATEYNQDLSGGWHPVLWATEEARLGNDQLCYRGTTGSSGTGMDLKVPSASGGVRGYMMLHSALVPTPDTQARDYTFGFQYHQSVAKDSAAMFFYNEDKELYLGLDENQEPIWQAEPTGADLWGSKDAAGLNAYERLAATTTAYTPGSMTRTAPEGTAYVAVAFCVTGSQAYRTYVDDATLSYEKTATVKPIVNLQAEAGDGQVVLSWQKAASDRLYNGVRVTVKNGDTAIKTQDFEGAETVTGTVTGLTNGTLYTFEVQSFNQDKTQLAEAVSVRATPRAAGQIVDIPLRNEIQDRTIYADDYEMTVDLAIVPDTQLTGNHATILNSIINRTKVFDTDSTEITFQTNDTPGVSIRTIPYRIFLEGTTWADVHKTQLVYKPQPDVTGEVTISVQASISENGEAIAQGTDTFQVTVQPAPSNEWKPQGDGRDVYLAVPNGTFDRSVSANAFKDNYNKDVPGGWHILQRGVENPVLGDDRMSYNVHTANGSTQLGVSGQGMDIKRSGAETAEGQLIVESAKIAAPSAAARKYTMGFQYKGTANGKPAAAMFFYNAAGELYMGDDVWKADATAQDMWDSKDAQGNPSYFSFDVSAGFVPAELERFAPEGTAYVTVAFGTTGGAAYRYQVDNVTLKYTDNAEPVIQGENPLEKTISLGESVNLKLEELFIDPDGDVMEFSAEEGKGKIENGVYTFTPNKLGNVTTSVTATDSYDGKATLQLNITVNDAVSTSVPNKDIQQVTREVVNGTISFSKTDSTEVTSLTQLNAGDTLKINLSLKNTSEIPVTATLIIVKYDTNGVVESVTTKVVVIPTTNGEPDYTAVRDYIVDNNTGHIEVMLWDSATNLNSLTDPIIL